MVIFLILIVTKKMEEIEKANKAYVIFIFVCSSLSLTNFNSLFLFNQQRNYRKMIIEKRRRDRINHSLNELRRLVPAAFERTGSAKLEKAEILQLTVEHLKQLRAKRKFARILSPSFFSLSWLHKHFKMHFDLLSMHLLLISTHHYHASFFFSILILFLHAVLCA